jgi:hypothetical protein
MDEKKEDKKKLSNSEIFGIVIICIIVIYLVYRFIKYILYKPVILPPPDIRDFTYLNIRESPPMERIVPVKLTSSQLRQIFTPLDI